MRWRITSAICTHFGWVGSNSIMSPTVGSPSRPRIDAPIYSYLWWEDKRDPGESDQDSRGMANLRKQVDMREATTTPAPVDIATMRISARLLLADGAQQPSPEEL